MHFAVHAANEEARAGLVGLLGGWLVRLAPVGPHAPAMDAAAAALAEGCRSTVGEVPRRAHLRAAVQVRVGVGVGVSLRVCFVCAGRVCALACQCLLAYVCVHACGCRSERSVLVMLLPRPKPGKRGRGGLWKSACTRNRMADAQVQHTCLPSCSGMQSVHALVRHACLACIRSCLRKPPIAQGGCTGQACVRSCLRKPPSA